MSEVIRVGILGLGVVGAGSLTVLRENAEEIARRSGRRIEVVCAAVKDLNKARNVNIEGLRLSSDPMDVVSAPDVDIVVEAIGGVGIANDLVRQALKNHKHVVTANKALIAKEGNALIKLAEDSQCSLAFEAAVCGGIPILKSIREGLGGNQIQWVAGIVNGTSNFVLSQMAKGLSFEKALNEAQELGYAEADPSFDIDGIDAAHKATILASLAFGIPLQFDKVFIEGIGSLAQQDVQWARQLGYEIKPLAMAKHRENGIELRAHPCLVPAQSMLAKVDGAMNAVYIQANAVGPTMYYGQGAGAHPTASSVVADIIDVIRTMHLPSEAKVPTLAFQSDSLSSRQILAIDECECGYYLRFQLLDEPGILASIAKLLADEAISIETMVQKGNNQAENGMSVVVLTYPCLEKRLKQAIKRIEPLKGVLEPVTLLRIEKLENND